MADMPKRAIVKINEPINLKSPDGWVSVYRGIELECGHWVDKPDAVKQDQLLECWDCSQAELRKS